MNNAEANVMGFPILHTGNHGANGNPHPQYYAPTQFMQYGNGSSGKTNQWIKLATISIDKTSVHDDSGTVKLHGLAENAGPIEFDILFYVRHQASDDSHTINLMISGNLNASFLAACISEDDANRLTVDLYYKSGISYASLKVWVIEQYVNIQTSLFPSFYVTVTYYPNATTWIASLPAQTTVYPVKQPLYSYVHAKLSSDLLLSANTWTKLPFVDSVDDLGEFASSKLTASFTGDYQISIFTRWGTDQPVNNKTMLAVYKNGSLYEYLSENTSPVSGNSMSHGCLTVRMSANDYLELWAYTANACTVSSASVGTHLTISRK